MYQKKMIAFHRLR